MRLLHALLAAVLAAPVAAQPVLFQYGAPAGSETGADVVATADGGFITVGSSFEDGTEAIYVVRAAAGGGVVWEQRLSVLPTANRGFSVDATPDGGALVVGAGLVPGVNGDWRPLVFRLDADGAVLWRSDETFAPTLAVDAGEARGFVRADGRVVLGSGSNTYSNPERPWLALVEPDGQTAQLRRFPSLATGFGVATYVYAVEPLADGTVMAGEISGFNEAFVWAFSAQNDSLWARSYRPEGVRAFYSAREAADGSLLLAGCTLPACTEAVAARIEADGTPRWVRVLDGDGGWYTSGRDLVELADGRLVLTRAEVDAIGSTAYRAAFDVLAADGTVLSTDPPVPAPPASLLLSRLTARADGSLLSAGTVRDTLGNADLAVLATALPRPTGSTARLQVIHNAADPAAAVVDVYVNGDRLLDDFAFRTATPFIDVPSDVALSVAVAPGTSTGVGDALYTEQFTLPTGTTTQLIASGVLNAGQFAPNPDARPTGFDLVVGADAQENAGGSDVAVRVVHGATDAPTVDVRSGGAVLVDDATYPDVTGYLTVPPAVYALDVTLADGTPVAAFTADLSVAGGAAATVLASGFLNPAANQNGPAFGLLAVFPDGTTALLSTAVAATEGGPRPGALALGLPAPNPLTARGAVAFSLDVPGPATLALYDALGRRVALLADGEFGADLHEVTVPADGLAPGTYVLRLQTASGARARTLTVVR